MNREYYNINNYEELIAKRVNTIIHACMPQLLTNIKAQQRIDDYDDSFNEIMNLILTISRQSKIMSIEVRVNIPVGVVVGVVVRVADGCDVGGGLWQPIEYK
jgi:hypothetical protein